MLKIALLLVYIFTEGSGNLQETQEMHLTGVYQGKTLFIQNPYNKTAKTYCITSVRVNDRHLNLNYHLSAIKIDFDGIDLNAPVAIRIQHSPGCTPVVVNPDAIFYHSMFSFREVTVSDTSIVWKTAGEQKEGIYVVEQYESGVWFEKETIDSKGNFGESEYAVIPRVEEGPNKFRIKYVFPSGEYLYSREMDLHFYPAPVTFNPHKVQDEIRMSRTAKYEIFDRGNKEVLSGYGNTIDVRDLPPGDYIIYFDDEDPGVFTKLR